MSCKVKYFCKKIVNIKLGYLGIESVYTADEEGNYLFRGPQK